LRRLRVCSMLTFAFLCSHLLFSFAVTSQTRTEHKPPVQHTIVTLEGKWAGSLQADDTVLHLVLHVSKSEDGGFKATLDSLDQAVYGIEVTLLGQKGSNLQFTVSSVGASFEGKISIDHSKIEGVWSQGNLRLPLAFHRQAAGAGAKKPSDAIASAEGVWQGALEANGLRLRLQLHVSHDEQKHLVAALDSPDQGISGLPAANVSQDGAVLHFEIPIVNGVYEGTLNTAKSAIAGSWMQNGVSRELKFQRSDQLLELVRPQNPVKPYPYREEEVSFSNEQAKISLAGTLTLPLGQGPFPAAILISGSGPHDRDETISGHRPFLVLADHLTRKGIAVLRFDKRGIGKSNGAYDRATSEDFAGDVQAALSYLRSRKEIDAKRMGLIGHSEGGLIAPMVAARSKEVAWIVLLAAPALKGEETLLLQSELILRAGGVNEEEIAKTREFNKQAYALVRQESDAAKLQAKLSNLVESSGMSASLLPGALQSQVRLMASPWFRFFLDYDPVPVLQKTLCPVLALNGEKDLQIASKENLEQIRKAFQRGGNKDFQITELPGLNHLFQHGPTGAPVEYGSVEETMAPEALNAISDWIVKHTSS
jgi:uncharacterized protein